MANTIYWYDFETTGTDPARDRVIQFAGVRTDLELNVIGEPLNLFCYPGDDVIPTPEAMLVTGLKMTELAERGEPETRFVERIMTEFSRPGTCVSGFNSIRFDDEFTRHLLYRNFLDPYAREWQSGNSRWDVIDFFRMAHALRPEGFEWPNNEESVPTFKLEELTRANGIDHETAHDAVSDVLATIDVTRALKQAQPKLFQYLYNLRHKKEVIAQLYPLGKAAVVHVSSMYPAKDSCLAVVLPLCSHPTNTNGVICYDLAFEPEELISLGPAELNKRLFTARHDLEAGTERIHLKTIHVNRCPAVAPLPTLTPAVATRLGIDLARCEENLARLKRASGIVEKVTEAFSQAEFSKTDDPDLMLYQGGFFSDRDRVQMQELRSLEPDALAKVTGAFDDERVEEMVFRYRARNYPESLNDEDRALWNRYRRARWHDGRDVEAALARIDELIDAGENAEVLSDLKNYVARIWSSVDQSGGPLV